MRTFMTFCVALLATCTLTSSVATIPLTRLQHTGAHLKGSSAADSARAALLKSRLGSGTITVPAINLAYLQYAVTVGIGNPPTNYSLALDLGSANTFCGSRIQYKRTPTSISTGRTMAVDYGFNIAYGNEYLDQLTLAPGLVLKNQSIGDTHSSSGFKDVDGILGLGPVNLTYGTLSSDSKATIPTVMNNLASQKLLEKEVFSLYLAPATNVNDNNGALVYGGVDSDLYLGELTYVPVTKTEPSSRYWGINITSCTYGSHTLIPDSTAGLLNPGITMVVLAKNIFSAYMSAIPGAHFEDGGTGLIEIPPSSVASMQPLHFTIGGQVFTLDVDAQLIPADENDAWGGVAGKRYGVVIPMQTESGRGLDFILGQKFLERHYSVYDADAHRVGLARTKHTFTKYE